MNGQEFMPERVKRQLIQEKEKYPDRNVFAVFTYSKIWARSQWEVHAVYNKNAHTKFLKKGEKIYRVEWGLV